MDAETIVGQALRAGVALYLKDGKLAYKVRRGEFPEDLKASIRRIRADIETYLAQLGVAEEGHSPTLPPLVALNRTQSRLSFTQERLWAIDRLAGGSRHYNLPFAIEMKGECRTDVLERAIATIVERHESLRTNFIEEGDEPWQIVGAASRFSLQRVDLSDLATEAIEAELSRRMADEAAHVFDLRGDVLLRASILTLAADRHVLLANMHHIASDGWSIGILIAELNRLYTAYLRDEANPLTELPVQYSDYAHWQRATLRGDALEAQKQYWLEVLEGIPRLHGLRTDKPRPPVFSFRGAAVFSEIGKNTVDALQAIGKNENATLFMVLQAAFATLLSRYSATSDIVIGTPVANREHPRIAGLIGCFINVLVLRYDVAGDVHFNGLLAQVRDRFINAMAHQDLPFEVLVEHAQPERSLSHGPLFQIAMVFQNNQSSVFDLPDLTARALEPEIATTKYDLTLVAKESNGSIRLCWEFATDLFERSTIERMASHMDSLLRVIARSPDVPLGQLEFVGADERGRLLRHSSGPSTPAPERSVVRWFEQQVSVAPEKIAIVFNGASLSYDALNRRANRLAHWLSARGVGPETLVALCTERSHDMVVGLLGILKAGAAYLPLDPNYPPARLQHMLSDSQARLVITQTNLAERLALTSAPVFCLDTDAAVPELSTQSSDNGDRDAKPTDLAYVIYTSGSTGLPKGVQIEHGAVGNFLAAMQAAPGFSSSDRLLAVTPISFDIHVLEIFLPLVSGGTLVISDADTALDGRQLIRLIEQERISVMQATPATWRLMLATEAWMARRTLKILCGGEAMDQALADALDQRASSLWNMYGPTEATVWASCARVEPHRGPVTIGTPLPNTQMYVLTEHGCIQPIGVVGEVFIGGAGLARGYLGREDLNRERFVAVPALGTGRLYRTGDLGYWSPEGELVCLGRLDSQTKIRGFRVELGEIEHHLLQLSWVEQAVVLGDGTEGERRLVAYVVPHESMDRASVASELRRELGRSLPEYMIPSLVVCLEQLPLTPNGKIDKQALVAPVVLAASHVAAVTEAERAVVDVLSELLRQPQVSVEGDFFELGGHSLMGARLIAILNRKFGCDLGLKDVFELRTARNLALHIDYLRLLRTQETRLQSLESVAHQEETEW